MADSIGGIKVSPVTDLPGPEGEAARAALGKALSVHVAREFNIPGLQLGVRYEGPIIAREENVAPPADEPNTYVASTYPGARAPHVKIGEQSLLDMFGRDFTLLATTSADTGAWENAAASRGMPLAILKMDDAAVRQQYGEQLVLIRPDHHIAWRGATSADAASVLSHALGHSLHLPAASVADTQQAVASADS
jgi:hypothetical protein